MARERIAAREATTLCGFTSRTQCNPPTAKSGALRAPDFAGLGSRCAGLYAFFKQRNGPITMG